jgi:glycosyltransferase involved in cell wall biosynthesis
MIYVDLSTGDGYGWGICGDNLAGALSTLTTIERIARKVDTPRRLPGPLLQKISDANLRPRHIGLSGAPHVGYVFFEDDLLAQRAVDYARQTYDVVATGCGWCEDILRQAGLTNVATVQQGVDTHRFNPRSSVRTKFKDRFVLFSGGKLELRKGQDLVVQAFKRFSQRHADAFLVAAWHNPWAGFAATMADSPILPFRPASGADFLDSLRHWIREAGVDLDTVELVPALPNAGMADIYRDSDVALFPSRCEGGTNLVLMEYMACGRAALATAFSGHTDILTDDNSYRLRGWRPLPITRNGQLVGCWCEPNVDEIVAQLEDAYVNRERLTARGRQAALDMREWTWARAARRFLPLLSGASRVG